jgi:hypothetical protein
MQILIKEKWSFFYRAIGNRQLAIRVILTGYQETIWAVADISLLGGCVAAYMRRAPCLFVETCFLLLIDRSYLSCIAIH